MKKVLVWILAVLVTLLASYYQKKSGPTYPLNIKSIPGDSSYTMKLRRSATIGADDNVEIPVSELFDSVVLVYSKYPGNFVEDSVIMTKQSDFYCTNLPDQPPAGKLRYYVVLLKNGKTFWSSENTPAIIRFKGKVPLGVLIPHVIAMLLAMLFSMSVLFMIFFKKGNYKRMTYLTMIFLFVGGFILGPLMQKFAFGEFWTGWPVGADFTDNKTLIVFVAWIIALLLNIRKDRKWILVIASLGMLIIFTIPHSFGGSELNHESGVVETGQK
jgi:hypothetical protein